MEEYAECFSLICVICYLLSWSHRARLPFVISSLTLKVFLEPFLVPFLLLTSLAHVASAVLFQCDCAATLHSQLLTPIYCAILYF